MAERGFWLQALIVGACITVWLTLVGMGVTAWAVTRAHVVSLGDSSASPALNYSAGEVQDATAQANVRSIIPSIESYYADNNTYAGMTLPGLKTTYDQALDLSAYRLSAATGTTFCVESTSGSSTWHKAGPSASIESGPCP